MLTGELAQRANSQSIYMVCMFCMVFEFLSVWVFELFLLAGAKHQAKRPQGAAPLCEPSELNSKTCWEINAVKNSDAHA